MTRVLLDEDVDVRFRLKLGPRVEVETVVFRGWKGMKNGELLRAAAEHFDVFVTLDGNLPYQQNLGEHDLAVVVLRPRSQALEHLEELVPGLERVLPTLSSGDVVEIRPPD
ncbi:MAG TPA: hypothetical protein VF188_13110 [Longimicrobiales bacterium]